MEKQHEQVPHRTETYLEYLTELKEVVSLTKETSSFTANTKQTSGNMKSKEQDARVHLEIGGL